MREIEREREREMGETGEKRRSGKLHNSTFVGRLTPTEFCRPVVVVHSLKNSPTSAETFFASSSYFA